MALSDMLSLRKSVAITDAEFKQLRDFIYSKSGIWVDDKRKYLFENRFGARLAALGLKSFGEYIKLLSFDPRKDQELRHVFELVTTNETSLFRDTKQLDGVRANILAPLLAAQRKQQQMELRIWCAGCSSGEEPYTLSIILHEMLGPELPKWRIAITAIDLSPAMVAKAKEGVYLDYAFKTTPEAIKAKYFTQTPAGFKIIPSIARLVRFEVMNLNDSAALKRIPKSHMVFCRNVIIYFDDAMKKNVTDAFYDNLLPGGHLILGHSESMHRISRVFQPKILSGSMAYQKA
ncbi:MAG: protein-glutamate O-methyltransferase CheR [Solidesulfovibrio sp.]